MKYDFDQIIDRRGSDCIKWSAYEADVLPLWVADMDFLSPQPVIDALRCRVDHGFFGYPEGIGPNGLSELRQAIVAWISGRHGWQIEPEWLVFVPGVVTGFNLAALQLQAGEGVLIQTPVYPPILGMAKEHDLQSHAMELTREKDGTYSIDWDRFEAAFTPQTRQFLLCNPHNPVGRVFKPEELARMAESCLKRGVTIVSDEIHCDLVFSESRHVPLAALSPEIAAQTITLMAPSKTFNLAGLQCSFAIIPNADLRKQYLKQRRELVPWVNLFGLAGALAAYREGSEWLDQLLPYLQSNRDYLLEAVQQHLPGVEMGCPEGTYLAWLDCRKAGIQGSPYKFFHEKARVALGNGETFGAGGEGFVRLNFGCPRPLLEDALRRMSAALQQANRA
jgi:cystathionine beta-lyase